MLDAAMQVLEQRDPASLTTNEVAERAGVSIGTLYQYFDGKQALMEALVKRELGDLSGRILASLDGAAPTEPGGRIRAIVRAALGSYGGRNRVHRMLIAHAMSRGGPNRLNPLYDALVALMSGGGVRGADGKAHVLPPADAFVLAHAVSGVLRTMITSPEKQPPRAAVEDALVRLVARFVS
ncbi:MAG TPA: TetR/AcrR family transcriptional regulator [Steroidobacteraceae bacterium]|nr:TetR/AcrR family transcriptional regulator [Steroidobacteraceae bacterium]